MSQSELLKNVVSTAFGKPSQIDYSLPGKGTVIVFSRLGTIIGTSRTNRFKVIGGKAYPNLKQAWQGYCQQAQTH